MKKKGLWIAIAVVCVLICIASAAFLIEYYLGLGRSRQLIATARSTPASAQPQQDAAPEQTPVELDPTIHTEPGEQPPESEGTEPEGPETVDIPVDFDALRKINPDIYAWLVVPGTGIDYPILQSAENDLYYNTHGADGKYFILGAVFSQRTHNTLTFEDPMTILYGHCSVFGQPGTFYDLNSYADQAYFDDHRQIIVYTPDAMYVYKVFAACNHSNEHILYFHNFRDKDSFDDFFSDFYDASKSCDHLDPEAMPEFGDRLLTLSTCYAPNKNQRYLIYSVLTDTFPAAAAETGEGS